FLQLLIRTMGRWTNKPKFHILLHLVMSVDLFGPPALFATQTLESYNAITHKASVLSNQQAPGWDIGNTADNGRMLKVLVTGSKFYDSLLCRRLPAGP
ncbi:hypothetical protein CROQUDRAFT_36863, partial [Cronartium quercuum f. sp. fusiforme G11]